ncbi:MAG: hypothetical protein ACLQEG_09615 [Acidimicrobiales bacterium]
MRVGLAVLEPQQLQRHVLSPQLAVHVLPVRERPEGPRRNGRREQQLLEAVVVKVFWERPGKSCFSGAKDVVGHRGEGDAERGAHLAAAGTFSEAQPDYISDLAHGDTGSGQRLLLGRDLSEEPAE